MIHFLYVWSQFQNKWLSIERSVLYPYKKNVVGKSKILEDWLERSKYFKQNKYVKQWAIRRLSENTQSDSLNTPARFSKVFIFFPMFNILCSSEISNVQSWDLQLLFFFFIIMLYQFPTWPSLSQYCTACTNNISLFQVEADIFLTKSEVCHATDKWRYLNMTQFVIFAY